MRRLWSRTMVLLQVQRLTIVASALPWLVVSAPAGAEGASAATSTGPVRGDFAQLRESLGELPLAQCSLGVRRDTGEVEARCPLSGWAAGGVCEAQAAEAERGALVRDLEALATDLAQHGSPAEPFGTYLEIHGYAAPDEDAEASAPYACGALPGGLSTESATGVALGASRIGTYRAWTAWRLVAAAWEQRLGALPVPARPGADSVLLPAEILLSGDVDAHSEAARARRAEIYLLISPAQPRACAAGTRPSPTACLPDCEPGQFLARLGGEFRCLPYCGVSERPDLEHGEARCLPAGRAAVTLVRGGGPVEGGTRTAPQLSIGGLHTSSHQLGDLLVGFAFDDGGVGLEGGIGVMHDLDQTVGGLTLEGAFRVQHLLGAARWSGTLGAEASSSLWGYGDGVDRPGVVYLAKIGPGYTLARGAAERVILELLATVGGERRFVAGIDGAREVVRERWDFLAGAQLCLRWAHFGRAGRD